MFKHRFTILIINIVILCSFLTEDQIVYLFFCSNIIIFFFFFSFFFKDIISKECFFFSFSFSGVGTLEWRFAGSRATSRDCAEWTSPSALTFRRPRDSAPPQLLFGSLPSSAEDGGKGKREGGGGPLVLIVVLILRHEELS